MDRKIIVSLFLMAFAMSTFLSIAGIIPVISHYFNVSITLAGLFVGMFAFVLGISGLVLPSYFSYMERKRFFIITLIVFIISSFLQIFIDNFYIALAIRIIPAFFYSSAISIALTMMGELSCNDVNKVILGVSAGTIFGLSISTHIAVSFGYPAVNAWIFLINVIALIAVYAFLPRMKGHNTDYFGNLHYAKEEKFIISVIFIFFIGIAISTVYNYISVLLLDLTHVKENIISIFLFANGIASLVGTSYFGHLLNKNANFAVLVYPITFIIVILALGFEITVIQITFILLVIFGILDGSMHTIAQYWINSSMRKAPEFANGIYLFINNANRTIGILIGGFFIDCGLIYDVFFASMVFFLLSTPFVLYRIKKYPNLR